MIDNMMGNSNCRVVAIAAKIAGIQIPHGTVQEHDAKKCEVILVSTPCEDFVGHALSSVIEDQRRLVI